MYLIDTNIHAAYLLQNFENDERTKQYLALYNNIALSDRVVPDFIVGEFETFIMKVVPSRYDLHAEDIQKLKKLALDYMYTLTHECTIVTPEIKMVERARDIYFENVTSNYMSFIDCLVLATGEKLSYTLLTKDKRMSTLAKKLNIACLEPQAR